MGYYEHDGCVGCEYAFCGMDDFPCRKCKGTSSPVSPEYKTRPDFWEPCEAETENDVVNHPSHYTQGDIECIDAMESVFGAVQLAAYCKMAVFKYLWCCEHKNGLEDVQKALWYMNKYLELERKANDKNDTAAENS